jgi:hypothetical protein
MSGVSNVGGTLYVSADLIPLDAPASGTSLPGASLLPHPIGYTLSGDVGAELAKLALEGSQDQRKLAKASRAIEEKAQEASEAAQLDALREKAANAFIAGVFAGVSSMASGVLTVAGAGVSANASASQVGGKAFEGVAKVIDGQGKLGSAGFQKMADESNVQATEAEQAAARHKRAVDDARDQADDAKKEIDRAIDFYKEYTAAKADEAKATLLRA